MNDTPKSDAFEAGFREAEKLFYDPDEPDFINPFAEGTDEWQGFEEAMYIFTQK